MAALETRAFVQAGGDFSLCPLSELQVPLDMLAAALEPVWAGEQELPPIYRQRAPGHPEQVAAAHDAAIHDQH
jgi:hypothetical protein